jgi:hypothetical protein
MTPAVEALRQALSEARNIGGSSGNNSTNTKSAQPPPQVDNEAILRAALGALVAGGQLKGR